MAITNAHLATGCEFDFSRIPVQVHTTREAWLHAAMDIMAPWINEADPNLTMPGNVKVSCSWAFKSGMNVLGSAASRACSATNAAETTISPALSDPNRVCDVLLHEMCHHVLGIPEGHGAKFGALVRSLGMLPPKTATTASPELKDRIASEVLPKVGPYPHSEMRFTEYTTPTGRKKSVPKGYEPKKGPGSPLLKVMCDNAECGYHFRVTAKWLDMALDTFCQCGGCMVEG